MVSDLKTQVPHLSGGIVMPPDHRKAFSIQQTVSKQIAGTNRGRVTIYS